MRKEKVATAVTRILPAAGNDFLDEATTKAQPPNYLFDELPQRLAKGTVSFRIAVQLAEDGDTVDNATIHWPETRPIVDLGTMTLNAVVPDNPPSKSRSSSTPFRASMASSRPPIRYSNSRCHLSDKRSPPAIRINPYRNCPISRV